MVRFVGKVTRRSVLELRGIGRLSWYFIQHHLSRRSVNTHSKHHIQVKNGYKFQVAVGINLFDGEELLIDLLLSFRPHVHRLYVAYQLTGHWGSKHPDPNLEKTLKHLRDIGLIDELIKFDDFEIARNELQFGQLSTSKMNMCVERAREQGCSHFMWTDNDEFFEPKQLKYLIAMAFKVWEPHDKSRVQSRKYRVGAGQHLQYYKTPEYIKKVREGEYVATFFPIDDPTIRFEHEFPSTVSISPERKPNISRYQLFSRFEVEMHHLAFVRHSLGAKAKSQQLSFGEPDPHGISLRYEAWNFPMPGVWSGGVEFEVSRTRQVIAIPHFYNHSFTKIGCDQPVEIYW